MLVRARSNISFVQPASKEQAVGAEMSANQCRFPSAEVGSSSAKILPKPFLFCFASLCMSGEGGKGCG